MNLYFRHKDDERCYTLRDSLVSAEFDNLETVQLYKAVRYKVEGFFWCQWYGVSEKNQGSCGFINCDGYEPRNGKSGCCKHFSNTFFKPGEVKTFKVLTP